MYVDIKRPNVSSILLTFVFYGLTVVFSKEEKMQNTIHKLQNTIFKNEMYKNIKYKKCTIHNRWQPHRYRRQKQD